MYGRPALGFRDGISESINEERGRRMRREWQKIRLRD